MSLENTLREMLNEMKMPGKGQLDPTVHTGPKKPSLDPTVHSGPKDYGGGHKPKPKTLTEPHSSLKEHYKRRLQEGLLGNIGKAVSQMDLSPGSLARATGRTASRIGNLVRGRGFKTGEDIAYERKEARAEAQRQVTPDAPKPPGRSGFVASAEEQKRLQKQLRDERENDERRANIRRRMLKDPRTDEISAWGGA
jgi:hypothetical protein